uniref:Polysulfide reductase n=1 Tax=Fervidicoccus fontis TaxID=683846 RepID=A0A7J3ZKP1_9CREN
MAWEIKIGRRLLACMLILSLLSALGLYSAYVIHAVPGSTNTDIFVPWGVMPAIYAFFVEVSTAGLCVLVSLSVVFNLNRFEPIVRRGIWLAIVTILVGLLVIVLELGRPERFYYAMLGHVNTSSPMLWSIYLYTVYFIFLVVTALLIFRRDFALIASRSTGVKRLLYRLLALGTLDTSEESARRDLRLAAGVGFVALVVGLSASGNLGNIFGALEHRALWHGPFMPLHAMFSGVASGIAVIILATIIAHWARRREMEPKVRMVLLDLRRLLALLIAINLLLVSWKYVVKAWSTSPHLYEAVETVVRGPLSFEFWSFEIILGLVVPLAYLIIPRIGKTLPGLLTASFLVLTGVFAERYIMIVGGLIPPVLPGTPHGVYVPSAMESLFTVGIFALAALISVVGELLLPLDKPLSAE